MADRTLHRTWPRRAWPRWAACLILTSLMIASGMARAGDLSGCWSGHWQSHVTGHHGPLWAEFVRTGDHQYDVFFRGRFFVLVPFRYSVTMTATEQPDGTIVLQGSQYLGRMFGTFTFSATATDSQFRAQYASCKDHGSFCLTRCTVACGQAP
jgi:hypothetical protein